MVEEMAKTLIAFSEVNRTHCFTHIINLIAKSLLKQFDLKEKDEANLTDEERELLDLAGNIEEEEQVFIMENDTGDGDTPDDNDMDGWFDEIEELTYAKKENLDVSVKPVHVMLVKVRVMMMILFRYLTPLHSFINSLSSLSTQLLSFFLHGNNASKIYGFQFESCHGMFVHAGIRHLICWNLLLGIEKLWRRLHQIIRMTLDHMN
jgi:hypothetical protein